MGLISQREPTDDSYSKEVISRLCKISPELEEYLITEQYLTETDKDSFYQNPSLWLRNRLVIKTIDQLSDRGIFINKDSDDCVDSPELVEIIITLREKFDQDQLYKFLKNHQSLCEDLTELIDDDCLPMVIKSFASVLTLSEDWIMLDRFCEEYPGLLMSNGQFNDLLTEVLDRCALLGDDDCIQDDDEMTRLLEYTSFLAARKTRILQITEDIYELTEDGQIIPGNRQIVRDTLTEFESELGESKTVRKFLDDEFTVKSFIEKEREFRVKNWKHCLEYWVNPDHQNEQPSYLNIASIVATLLVDAPDKEHARVYVIEQFESYLDQYGDRYENLRKYIDRALGNLVIKETMNNEIK